MDQILDAPLNSERNFKYAGFWIRAAAYFIDTIVIWLIMFLLMMALGFKNEDPTFATIFPLIVIVILVILYFPIMESSTKQGTVGKMAVGIRVGDKQGNVISFWNALGRFFAKILSGLILYIGYMMAGWDPKKQALHDKLADTYVFYA